MLKDIFSDDNYRFCGQNDIGVNRIVGWHKDKLNNKYASYESTDIWAPYMGAKNIILVGHDGGSINGEANFKGYHTSETMDQKNTDEYKRYNKAKKIDRRKSSYLSEDGGCGEAQKPCKYVGYNKGH